MKLVAQDDVVYAADVGDGLCLACGTLQPFVERDNARFGLCEECEEQRVLRCEDVRDALWWIDTGDVA